MTHPENFSNKPRSLSVIFSRLPAPTLPPAYFLSRAPKAGDDNQHTIPCKAIDWDMKDKEGMAASSSLDGMKGVNNVMAYAEVVMLMEDGRCDEGRAQHTFVGIVVLLGWGAGGCCWVCHCDDVLITKLET